MKTRWFWFLAALLLMSHTSTWRKSLLPPGFVLMAGKEGMQPFLMGENPVSNYEYLLYMEWLRKIYVDYPEVYKLAKPQAQNPDILYPCNDPYSSSYFGHPAFADYPVVGVNWVQAMEYCSWKNDRLNEALLVEMGNLDWKKQLSTSWNENNFNTEAYLNGQYAFSEHPTKNMWFFHYQKSTQFGTWGLPNDYYSPMKINSADAFPEMLYGARLPSEDEWDYYMANSGKKTKWYVENSYAAIAEYVGLSEGMQRGYGYNRDYAQNACFTQKNFREWMLDTFTPIAKTHNNLRGRLAASGCYMPNMPLQFYDAYGSLREKDSMGRFGFRIFGWEPGGEAICFGRYGYKSYNFTQDMRLASNDAFTDSAVAIFKENGFDTLRAAHKGYVPDYHINANAWCSGYWFGFTLDGVKYNVLFNLAYQSASLDIEYLKNTAQYTFNCKYNCVGGCENVTDRSRVTKNKANRKSEFEMNGQNDVGFRVLIPWYGSSIKKPIAW